MATTKKVGWTDVAYAGTRTSALIGPVDHHGEEHARAGLRSIAEERGPSGRVGLVPSSTTNAWAFDPERFARVSTIEPLPLQQMLRAFEMIVADASVGEDPVVMVFCGDYLMLSADHGFGDATACLETLAVASGMAPDDYAVSDNDRPLASALINAFGRSARDAMKVFRTQPAHPTEGAIPTRTYPTPDVRNIVATYVCSEPGTFNAIRKLRKESFPDVSMSAAVSYLIRRGLHEHGVNLTDDLGALVDLRRFLPQGCSTLANLPGIAELVAPATCSLAEYGKAYGDAVASHAPLLRLAASLVKRRLSPSGNQGNPSDSYPDAAKTVFSDPSLHPSMKKIRWVDRGYGLTYALINNPGVPHQVPITTMWDQQGRLNITASYYSSSFDRAMMDEVLSAIAAEPVRYLQSATVT